MSIVPIKGATKFTINLDPGIWIFDQRKIDLPSFISTGELLAVGEREVDGSYAIPFEPFISNAQPLKEATSVICHRRDGSFSTLTLEEAFRAVIAFAHEGKPLREDGPIHVYRGAGQHASTPITHVVAFEVAE